MTLNVNASSPKQEVNTPKKQIVYVSKTPEVAVNATGVVAGTSGMIGGAILGGIVGASSLPGEYIKQVAQQNYSKVITDAIGGFKTAISNAPELAAFSQAIKEAKSPAVAEEILHIAKTLSTRLHETFKNNPTASSVIDKVIDPFIKSISVKENIRNYGSGIRAKIKSPVGQFIMKLFGFNKPTSKIVGDITGNMAAGITSSVQNIIHFSPEEKAAWKEISKQIVEELEHNPKIKLSTGLAKALKGMFHSFEWITQPLKNLQSTIVNASKELNRSLKLAPLKTIGIYGATGAAVCSALSLLAWGGLKKVLMKKEKAKSQEANLNDTYTPLPTPQQVVPPPNDNTDYGLYVRTFKPFIKS